MFTQPQLEAILALGIVLICLGAATDIYWILNGWQIDTIRRAFARLVWRWEKDHRVEAYVEGLRKLAEGEQ